MKCITAFVCLCFLKLTLLFSNHIDIPTTVQPSDQVVIVGGGIIGAMETYYAYLDAIKKKTKVRIKIYEKDSPLSELLHSNSNDSTNTAFNIFPSLTADEILSVVPRGPELVEKLAILFSEPGGIRVDDVPGANDSLAAIQFKEAVEIYGRDKDHDDRTKNLLMLGKISMDLWQNLYEQADEELKSILKESNYNSCHDPKNKDTLALHEGYRIDLIYDVLGAQNRAEGMQATYEQLGYLQCRVLSPKEVITIDPSLTDFCHEHSELDNHQELKWKKSCSALWRPGGCINTRIFLPNFYNYLKKIMGTYVDSSGKVQDCLTLEFNKEVTAVEFDKSADLNIVGLKFSDGTVDHDSGEYNTSSYVFCPGESVGTLRRLGFEEPTYAGFAGPSLFLNIPLSSEQSEIYKNFSHCMEVHKVGIVLAWQARFKSDSLIIGVAGTKAFYGDQQPTIDQAFAMNRHLVQLNMINDVLPEMVSIACGRNTKGVQLQYDDMVMLEKKDILKRWVGRRAVAYDGFPTFGTLYCNGYKVNNARCTTQLGSGGVSFAPAAVKMSRSSSCIEDEFTAKILQYADSKRQPRKI